MRWRIRLSEFDFEVQYKKGLLNTHTDSFYRFPTSLEAEPVHGMDITYFVLEKEKDNTNLDPEDDIFDAILVASSAKATPGTFVPVTAEDILREQKSDPLCTRLFARLNGGAQLPFATNDQGYLFRTVKERPQIVVAHFLQSRVLNLSRHAKLSAHLGARRLYYTLRKHLYWPAMTVNAYATVSGCSDCARNIVKLRKYSKNLVLFPAQGPLEFVTIDILGEFFRTPRGNCCLLVISHHFSELEWAIPFSKVSATFVSKTFVTQWVFTYVPPIDMLFDSHWELAAKFFQDVCRILDIKN